MRPAVTAAALAAAAAVAAAAPLAALARRARSEPPETEVAAAQLAAAIRARNARAIVPLLHKRLDVAGVWFADAACRKRFAQHAELEPADGEAFARCLAQLKLQLSTRRSAQADGAVLTYEPGIELELQFARGVLTWIGYEAQGARDANLPTLSAQAFEALRRTGTTNLDDAVGAQLEPHAAMGPVTAWLKVCLDATGAMTVRVREASSPRVGQVFAEAVRRGWAFRPFVHGGKPLPVCSLSLLTYPAAKAVAVEVLPIAAADEP